MNSFTINRIWDHVDKHSDDNWNMYDTEENQGRTTCEEERSCRDILMCGERRYRWAWCIDWLKECSLSRKLGGDNRTKTRRKGIIHNISCLVEMHTLFDQELFGEEHSSSSLNNSLNNSATSMNDSYNEETGEHSSLMEDMSDGNTCFVVSGAGSQVVNGRYVRSGMFDSVPKWSYTNPTNNIKYTLFRVEMNQNKNGMYKPRNWYLSQMSETKPGTKDDVGKYSKRKRACIAYMESTVD